LTILERYATHSVKWGEKLLLSRRAELLPVFIVSSRLGLSVGFLEHARRAGFGPPYVRVGKEARYDWPKVVAWSARCGLSPADPKVPVENASRAAR
jgi:hypothetical protein